MASSSDSGALTRRRTRRQPLRRCKRFRGNPGGGPFLVDIPESVLRHILGFTMWEDEPGWREWEREAQRCLRGWKWTGELGIVCRIFRRVVRHVVPDELLCTGSQTSLLRSFQENPWKKRSLVKLSCRVGVNTPSLLALFEQPASLLALFKQPDSLPNLEKLHLSDLILNATVLYTLARSCPNLSELHVYHPYGTVTPDEFGTFGQMLRRPIHSLCLTSASWMTDAHLGAFLPHQGQSLTDMRLSGGHLTDVSFDYTAQHCRNLEKFGIVSNQISTGRLRTFLRATPSLREFGVSPCCSEQWSEPGLIVEILIQCAPQLEKIHFSSCRLLTDDLLDRLVQGQIDYWTDRREQIRLVEVYAVFTSVTRGGVGRVLAKPNVGRLHIRWGD